MPDVITDQITVALADDHHWVFEVVAQGDAGFLSRSRVEFTDADGVDFSEHGFVRSYTHEDAVDGANLLISKAPEIVRDVLGDRRFQRPSLVGPSIADELFG